MFGWIFFLVFILGGKKYYHIDRKLDAEKLTYPFSKIFWIALWRRNTQTLRVLPHQWPSTILIALWSWPNISIFPMLTIFCCRDFLLSSSFVLFFFTQTFGADCHYQLETWSMDLGHLTGVPQDVSDCIYHNFLLPERTAVRWEGFKNRAFLQLTYSQENFL